MVAVPGRRLPAVDFRRPLWWAVAAGTAAALVGLVALLVWARSGSGTTAVGSAPRVLAVNPSGAGGAYRTLGEALKAARHGDKVVLEADIREADVEPNRAAKGLTIEAAPGTPVTWGCPRRVRDGAKLLLLGKAQGFVLKGVTLDGGGRLDDLISVWGESPGLRLEGLQLRGFKKHAITVANCAGTADQPVRLTGLCFETGSKEQSGVYFDHAAWLQKDVPRSEHISFRNCFVNGPGKPWAGDPKFFGDVDLQVPAQ
jgi:hypothetical protein